MRTWSGAIFLSRSTCAPTLSASSAGTVENRLLTVAVMFGSLNLQKSTDLSPMLQVRVKVRAYPVSTRGVQGQAQT